jgi:pyrrolidone-carboxylate peptidase
VVAVVPGFGPFGDFATNPAELLVRPLAARRGPDVTAEVLPVSQAQVASAIPELHGPLLPELVTEPERQPSMARSLQEEGLDVALDVALVARGEAGLYVRRTA